MDRSELIASVRGLRSHGRPDRPSRHQAILLLWALGRARRGLPRLTRWSNVRNDLKELLAAYGLPESAPTPEYPFVALARTEWWELGETNGDVPTAHGSGVLGWLNSMDPLGGLSLPIHEQLSSDDVARGEVVSAILNRYFTGERCDDLLRIVGLYGTEVDAPNGWDLQVGDVARRQVIHDRFGGQEQGGISTPTSGKMVLLFADSVGLRYGYDYDGWKEDGSYHYTGQGRTGDQRFTAINRAVLDPGREIHIFEEAARTIVRYVGRFKPDSNEPYYRADALDAQNQPRSVIVFRLWPADRAARPSSATNISDQTTSYEVPLEAHNVGSFASTPGANPTPAKRREAALIQRYIAWLHEQDVSTVRNAVLLAGQPRQLYTDLFNQNTRELVEAKGTATRDHVRLALGQVLDYARYVPHDALAVLLPVRPAEDLVDLLAMHGVSCIYEAMPGEFERVDARQRRPKTRQAVAP